ncbi:MAG TPA: hypothetical protein VG317_04605 [Pseudonocardiaceae bacterium]|nr:hypothetical protein [Pseudonocardiaceae bacterium]
MATADSAYQPYQPARRPGGRPDAAPTYRVLVHRQYRRHWEQLVTRVGLQQAQELWDHLAQTPGKPPMTANSCILRGRAGRPKGPGWSRTVHFEVSSMARIDYQHHDEYTTNADGDPHPVVAILTINFSSH